MGFLEVEKGALTHMPLSFSPTRTRLPYPALMCWFWTILLELSMLCLVDVSGSPALF